jgi:uncharacterized lipoprotein YajG
MKKELTIAGLILAGGLVLLGAGCAQKPATQVNTNAAVNEAPGAGNVNENVNAAESGVTEGDINQLKSDINAMNYEDLNGLSQ